MIVFTVWVVWPNLSTNPSVVMVIVLALALIWLIGAVGTWLRFEHADELMLCGSLGPVIVGLVQLGYRLQFLWVHQALATPHAPPGSATAFALLWGYETMVILLPGILFTVWNARNLTPLPPSRFN
jgi:hypothetical protein